MQMISDNAKTFKAAAGMILEIVESAEVKQYFTTVNIKWSFNLERAPWWGGGGHIRTYDSNCKEMFEENNRKGEIGL